ncbi:hypothetical protein JCGZ_15682 [Jatropha curcas]|uniref:Heparanase-like protein 2 n=1 Tax=Jatropha curcas TaxID=180498 RepID=A0A067L9W3_JATCU|nr:hypothetical protein JCGZ_15682 [Jatropha curcas]
MGVTSIARTDDTFVCATLDWWPSTKCNYQQCPWGKAGLLNLDLKNKILINALKAFGDLRIRIGGSLQDQVVYKVGHAVKKFPHFKRDDKGLFGFTKGNLPMDRWDQINRLFNQTGVKHTFGLNALFGKKKSNDSELYLGNWNPRNAADLMKYTISKGYKIDSYELGNELCSSGVSARIDAVQYSKDIITLRKLVNKLYPNPDERPGVLGPAGFYDEKWFNTFLQETGPNVVDGLTHHIYNLGPGDDKDLINKIQDPYFLNEIAQTHKDISNSVKQFGPWSGAWVGEAGGAYNSGGKDVSHYFVNGFCALLWHRLMGKNVLATSHDGTPYLRAYSHCSKQKPGVALLLINMSNHTTFRVTVLNDHNPYPGDSKLKYYGEEQQREEYHLTPKDGNIQSDVLLLNGTPLKLTSSLDIPAMEPKLVTSSSPITIAPDSIVFVVIRNLRASACA